MAALAEVSVPPAEPLGNRATKSAFELDVLFPMLWAILNWNFAAIGAYELLLIELSLILLHCILASLTPAKVWFLAFIALVIGEDSQGIFCWFIIEGTGRVD